MLAVKFLFDTFVRNFRNSSMKFFKSRSNFVRIEKGKFVLKPKTVDENSKSPKKDSTAQEVKR